MSPGAKLYRALRDQAREDARRIVLWRARAEVAIVLCAAVGIVIPAAIGALTRLPN